MVSEVISAHRSSSLVRHGCSGVVEKRQPPVHGPFTQASWAGSCGIALQRGPSWWPGSLRVILRSIQFTHHGRLSKQYIQTDCNVLAVKQRHHDSDEPH